MNPCPKSPSGLCPHGGNKYYNFGFLRGTASYCWLVKKWVSDLPECPLAEERLTLRDAHGDEIEVGDDDPDRKP